MVECPCSQTAAFCKIRQLLPNCGFFKQPQASLYCTSYCCFTTARFHLNWSLLVSGQNFGLGISFGSHKLIYTARHLTTGNIFASIEASLSVVFGSRLFTTFTRAAKCLWPRGDEAKVSSQTRRGQDPIKTTDWCTLCMNLTTIKIRFHHEHGGQHSFDPQTQAWQELSRCLLRARVPSFGSSETTQIAGVLLMTRLG